MHCYRSDTLVRAPHGSSPRWAAPESPLALNRCCSPCAAAHAFQALNAGLNSGLGGRTRVAADVVEQVLQRAARQKAHALLHMPFKH